MRKLSSLNELQVFVFFLHISKYSELNLETRMNIPSVVIVSLSQTYLIRKVIERIAIDWRLFYSNWRHFSEASGLVSIQRIPFYAGIIL